jgi:hypothetical protein
MAATEENLRQLHDRILAVSGARPGGAAQPQTGPKLNERRKFGDKIGEWNGKEWIQVGQ